MPVSEKFNIFEKLPIEILFQIFANLPLAEVVKFKHLNKQLTQLVNNYLAEEIKVKKIACGYNFSLILLESGRVFAMGANNYGQLGLLGEEKRLAPSEIIGIEPIAYLSVGFTHAIMLSQKKRIWIMGNNAEQQLSFKKDALKKIQLQCVSTKNDVEKIIACDFTTAYSDKNGIYQLGNNHLKPLIINNNLKLLPRWLQIPVNLNIADISAGKEHVLLLTAEGSVYGIGSNKHGLLGLDDKITHCENWTLLPIKQAIKIKATDLASFILMSNQDLMAAGINSARQLEVSDIPYFSFFKKIAVDIINFDAHEFHTIYIDSSGKLYALGNNDQGQLGIGLADCSKELLQIDKPKSTLPMINKNSENSPLSLISLVKSTSPFFKPKENKGIKDSINRNRDNSHVFN
ncbi:Cell cycle control protein [Legionella busanensis]|uniref:Cell cycle control protein n=1 Tax=Legionella busanensis TaxID=190655 RepID=A0A378JJM2_9GAMM|nr:F-box protein [Legionella busanensis]STX51415.1 Cell cycle control protein [Legionella busanensis]